MINNKKALDAAREMGAAEQKGENCEIRGMGGCWSQERKNEGKNFPWHSSGHGRTMGRYM